MKYSGGRTGALFAFQPYNIQPDILLLAKGFGGGMPIGAFIASRNLMQVLSFNPPLGHITIGGHPVCAAAALATLKVLLENTLISEVAEKEALFKHLLVHPDIINCAGGLPSTSVMRQGYNASFSIANVALSPIGFYFNDKSIRIAPPLIITAKSVGLPAPFGGLGGYQRLIFIFQEFFQRCYLSIFFL